MPPRVPVSPPIALIVLVALAFVLPGLTGHDLWKTQDAIGLGIVHAMAAHGEFLVPHIAGIVWLQDPPLYHWVATGMGLALGGLIEFQSAARLASGAFMLLALAFLFAAGRRWSATEDSRMTAAAAPLVLIGSVGLLVYAHEALPELASLAALSGALAALPFAGSRPVLAGLGFGAAVGAALLAAGWMAPAALTFSVVLAHFACDEWRTRKAPLFLAISLLLAGGIWATWPAALAGRSPELLSLWRAETFSPEGNPLANFTDFISTGSWFAWPGWALALWTLWSLRHRLLEPRLFVPVVAIFAMLGAISLRGPSEDVALIPLLAPLALLAAQGAPRLRRGAAAALDWFGVLTFALSTGIVWLGYLAMVAGVPPRFSADFARMAPGFVARFEPAPFVLALGFTAGWLYLVFFSAPSPVRAVLRWAAGAALLWGSVAMLWMPWVDYQKSYRPVARELRARMPERHGCLAVKDLGISQASALDYYAGIRGRPYDPLRPRACPLLLVQGSPGQESDGPGPGWEKLADVGRPGDRSERYRLYRRLDR